MINENYKIIKTNDGSYTYFSKRFAESCHSLSGAKEETLTHYVKGCKVSQKALEKPLTTILEVGFGTGLGFLTTKNLFKSSKCTFISLEIDIELISLFEDKYKIILEQRDQVYTHKSEKIDLIIFLGNARNTIQDVKQYLHTNQLSLDCIYQDAFSPKKNSLLWTKEWFSTLRELSNNDCIMSTYSSASSVRKSMIEAGWNLYEGEAFGTKKSSTRARINGATENSILEKLDRSSALILTDKDL